MTHSYSLLVSTLTVSRQKKLREERILMGYEGAAAQYLSKVMSESDIEVLKDSLKNAIFTDFL